MKHYVRTGLAGLLRDLKVEAGKVTALKPTRYLLVTSVSLSPANKQAIAAVFSGRLAVSDVLGQDDLNNLLGRHPEVEHKHYKLWLASPASREGSMKARPNGSRMHASLRWVMTTDVLRGHWSAFWRGGLDTLSNQRPLIARR